MYSQYHIRRTIRWTGSYMIFSCATREVENHATSNSAYNDKTHTHDAVCTT